MSQSASKGLGDDIEKITKATGIKKVVDTFAELTGIDCGCDARKAKLNKLFPQKNTTIMFRGRGVHDPSSSSLVTSMVER